MEQMIVSQMDVSQLPDEAVLQIAQALAKGKKLDELRLRQYEDGSDEPLRQENAYIDGDDRGGSVFYEQPD